MSGLIEKSSGNNAYLYLYKGVITQKVKPGTEGASQRENKRGDVVFEKQYGGIAGYLTDIKRKESEFDGIKQFSWQFVISYSEGDEKKNFILEMPETSRVCDQIMKRLPNVDFAREIELRTGEGTDKETGKPFQWAAIEQGGVKIAPAFTKDDPKGMPPLQQAKIRGQVVWDNSDQLAFFEKMINEEILPKIKSVPEKKKPAGIYPKDVKTDMSVFNKGTAKDDGLPMPFADNMDISKDTPPTDDLPF